MEHSAKTLLRVALVVLAIFTLTSIGWAQADAEAKLKPIFEAYKQAWVTGDVKTLDAVVDSNITRRHIGQEAPVPAAAGLDSLKRVITNFRAAYPDVKVVFTKVIYTPDKIVVHYEWSGTHSGKGLPAEKGKKAAITGVSELHIKNGKITAIWVKAAKKK